ncbi:hypothetical protein N24_2000 [Corynebacterium suranareeae]|uniref:Uncharacterized protein n=1 Tax=Corynebacterium suranareeae TaxID=2506452 RepID=A0A161JP35_9CORY|nr:hypothetical protein [Corynebacterium suranareeae]BAU96262.1 hypothetical protein N24_2000 [Corynebacterium suranareeae]
MTIYAANGLESGARRQGVVVPSAAVWMQEVPSVERVKKRHVRTIDCSNSDRFCRPESLRILPHGRKNYPISQQHLREHFTGSTQNHNPHARSIKESLKQWAGGGLFGLVIFAGIVLSQSGEEEATQTFYETQVVGVSLDR